MAVVRNVDGRLEVFAAGVDRALIHIWQPMPNAGPWSAWERLGYELEGAPSPCINADGRLDVFFRTWPPVYQLEIYHVMQAIPSAPPWTGLSNIGGALTEGPVTAHTSDGRIEVFARGLDDAIWHISQMSPNGAWDSWKSLGGEFRRHPNPLVIGDKDGRLRLFGVGDAEQDLVMLTQRAASSHDWANTWESLGFPTSRIGYRPAVARNQDGSLQVFAWINDRTLWHRIEQPMGWTPWALTSKTPDFVLPGPDHYGDGIFAGRNADGRLELFGRGRDLSLWHSWQTAPNKQSWSEWESLGGELSSPPVIATNADGRLEVFARGTGFYGLHHIWQTEPNGSWSGWDGLGDFKIAELADSQFDA